MANYAPPPITAKQIPYLSRLIHAVGKEKYLAAKRRLGFPHTKIMDLSKHEAARLISELAGRDGER